MSFRLACQLQKQNDNLETSSDEFDNPPSNDEAVSIIKSILPKGRKHFPKDRGRALKMAVDKMVNSVKSCKGKGFIPKGNGDNLRKEFSYMREKYRVDLRIGGKAAKVNWFV